MEANTFFKCKDEKDIVYERLYSFKSEETGKHYMIFTDNKLDLRGNIRILFGIYDPRDDVYDMLPLENEGDLKIVEREWKKQLYGDDSKVGKNDERGYYIKQRAEPLL